MEPPLSATLEIDYIDTPRLVRVVLEPPALEVLVGIVF